MIKLSSNISRQLVIMLQKKLQWYFQIKRACSKFAKTNTFDGRERKNKWSQKII